MKDSKEYKKSNENKLVKDFEETLSRTLKFCRKADKNLKYIKQTNSNLFDFSKPASAFYLKIESINGVKKDPKDHSVHFNI